VDAVADNTASAAPRSPGQALAAERERQGLSRADVAQRLHMSAWQVEALEGGDYKRLPKGTFLRGFVRNYAKLLGLDANPVLALLNDVAPALPAPGIVVPTQNIRFDPMSERLSSPYVKASVYAVVAVAIGFAGMYYWMYMRPSLTKKAPAPIVEPVVSSAPVAEPPPVAASVAATAPVEASPPVASTEAKAEARKANALAREAPKTVEPSNVQMVAAARGADRRIKFHFKGESWVEVRDGRGKVLIQRLNNAGSDAEITGKPPFQIIVGNAPDVQMSLNDQAFDLEPHTRVAVARFTVE
jgi:cytoskeleton protein RodZ